MSSGAAKAPSVELCLVLLGFFPLALGQKGSFFTNTSCDGEVFQKYFSKSPLKEFTKFQKWICSILKQKVQSCVPYSCTSLHQNSLTSVPLF